MQPTICRIVTLGGNAGDIKFWYPHGAHRFRNQIHRSA